MSFVVFVALLLQFICSFFIILTGVIALYCLLSSKFMYESPPVPSCGKVKAAMIEDVAGVLAKRKNQVVMDLGSGWGSLLIPLAKRFPQHRFIGIEHAFIPYYVSRFRTKKMPNITFYRQNFFYTDISKADIIFLFLLAHVMSKISVKCQKEAKKGALFYVNRFFIKNKKAQKEVSLGSKYNTYYVYKN